MNDLNDVIDYMKEKRININLKDAGGFGMGEYPAEITISLLVNFK